MLTRRRTVGFGPGRHHARRTVVGGRPGDLVDVRLLRSTR